MKAKKWILAKKFQGEPKKENLQLVEEALPTLKQGDILIEALCWSVDPYMRSQANSLSPGDIMVGQQLAKVTESKNKNYPVGKLLTASVGWRTHMVCNPDKTQLMEYAGNSFPVFADPADYGSEPSSTTLGVLGMPGATAYLGLMEICNPQPGETVLVNGAAGAVGSLVGQIAKIKGCKVIGFAGTDEKVRYLKKDLGFDYAFNYKTDDISKSIKKAAPEGIDCYFDNVGGSFSSTVLFHHMNTFGRVTVCGSISRYNEDMSNPEMSPELFVLILVKQLRVQGFVNYRYVDKYHAAWSNMLEWIKQGKLKYREHRTKGFENMREAFYGMLKGQNTGKAVITP